MKTKAGEWEEDANGRRTMGGGREWEEDDTNFDSHAQQWMVKHALERNTTQPVS